MSDATHEIGSDAWTIEKLRSFNIRLLAWVEELQKMVKWQNRALVDAVSEASGPVSDKTKGGG